MHNMRIKKYCRPGRRLDQYLSRFIYTIRVCIKPLQLPSILAPGQTACSVTTVNNAKASGVGIRVIESHHHVGQLLNMITVVYPVGGVLVPTKP